MSWWDKLSGIADQIGGGVEDITGVLEKVGQFKGQLEDLRDVQIPNFDIGSVLGKWGGFGGGFDEPEYPRQWKDDEGNVWYQKTKSSPPEIIFHDPGTTEVLLGEDDGGMQTVLLVAAVGVVALLALR